MLRHVLAAVLVFAAGCATTGPPRRAPPVTVVLSVVGTSDLHGHVAPEAGRGGVALLGGYLANLRAARAADGGGVLLLDAGDLFQGTLESNPGEGAAVVAAYRALGYDAAAVGNHEFDFGPAGPLVVAASPADDPRGALRARAAEADFPFLTANVIDEATGKPLAGKGLAPSTILEVAGVKVGVLGVTTIDTPGTTLPVNFVGLRMRPLAETVDEEARRLRAAGAEIVVVVAHAGLCKRASDDDVVQECDFGEILDTVRALKEPVEVVVAGHTHIGATRREGDVAITQAWKYGRGFGRVDLVYDRARRRVVRSELHAPRLVVEGDSYEGALVVPDARVAAAVAPYIEGAAARRAEPLGVVLETPVPFSYDRESALGNLVADLMRAARPEVDLAIINGGSLRRDLGAGELTYGVLFEAYPFDNRLALVRLSGRMLREIFAGNLSRGGGVLNVSGLRVAAACKGAELDVRLVRDDGRPVGDDERLTMVTSDYLMGGGLANAPDALPSEETKIEPTGSLRDVVAAMLRRRGGALRAGDFFDPARPRLSMPGGKRPVTCAAP